MMRLELLAFVPHHPLPGERCTNIGYGVATGRPHRCERQPKWRKRDERLCDFHKKLREGESHGAE